MLSQRAPVDDFVGFVELHEPKLRHALVAGWGEHVGRDAACDALAYGWEHWTRVRSMANPAGYLYRVGANSARRRRRPVVYFSVEVSHLPDVEPALPGALARLSERQRSVVVLVHCFEWSMSEVGDLLGLSKSTVQNHLERGMRSLRRELGLDDS